MEMKLNTSQALDAFSSLSQETRLSVYRLLLEYGRDGAPPTLLAEELGIPINTLSFHLAHLSRAGLVTSKRKGRSILYFSNTQLIRGLIDFLDAQCCKREKNQKNACDSSRQKERC